MSNIQVAVRARPLSQRELDLQSKISIEMRSKSTILFKTVDSVVVGQTRDDSKEFEYDHSYWSVDPRDTHFISQEQVYNDLGKSVLESAFQGYNACVFAYGQTGSGKTHTMMGSEDSPGLIPRICESLYAHIANGNKRNVSYRVEASYMEIYNEKVRDLLLNQTPSKIHQQIHSLKVREHPKEGPYVENLSRHIVSDFQEISSLMKIGNSHRVTASTKMNDVSSRSHAIFTILFTQAAYECDVPCETVSKIHLVDLAGSERASATGAEGLRLKEGGNINKSLACLGNVISALADMSSVSNKGRKSFVPYRDSVLTWLLKDSLGGNAKTIMVAAVSPAEVNYGETLSTLRYASRAKNIINKPVVNEDANVKLIRELRDEIRRLKSIITAAKLEDSEILEENIHKKEEMIAELTKSWAGKWDHGIQRMVEERDLALRSEGIKMTLASERPHLLALDNDASGGGVVIYHLKIGQTTIGAIGASPSPDIELSGDAIQPRHCAVDNSSGRVRLVLADGRCYVNQDKVDDDTDLSHGDLLQIGDVTVFRFNHPEEAQTLKQMTYSRRAGLLPLSPTSTNGSHDRTSELEEQREALERDYNEKMQQLRDELEKKNSEDKAKLIQELDTLRQLNISTPTSDDTQDEMDNGPRSNTTYDLLQSIARTPICEVPDIKNRIVIGRESRPVYSPDCALSYQSSIVSSCGSSPAPEEHKQYFSIEQEQIDEETVDISFVDENEENGNGTEKQNGYCSVDAKVDGVSGDSDGDYIFANNNNEEDNEDTRSCDLKLKATLDRLREKEIENEEIELEKNTTLSKLTEAERRGISLRRHLKEQKSDFLSQQEKLENKVETLQNELRSKDLSGSLNIRRRSHAFGEKDSPQVGRRQHRRSNSATRSLRAYGMRFMIEVPGCLLRGSGWNAYHVYEVRIILLGEKWSIFKSYAQCKIFREEVVRRYDQLSVLAFPASKWFKVKNCEFVERRRMELQTFLQSLMAICSSLPTCPLYDINSRRMTRTKLYSFSSFFEPGSLTGL